MWTCTPPSSTIRRASAAYSSGVYGIAGHWSRLASDPEIEQVMTTGSSRLTGGVLWQEVGSATPHLFTGSDIGPEPLSVVYLSASGSRQGSLDHAPVGHLVTTKERSHVY